jgi:hypothetical protein
MSCGPTSPTLCQSRSMLLALYYLPTMDHKQHLQVSIKAMQKSGLSLMAPVQSMGINPLSSYGPFDILSRVYGAYTIPFTVQISFGTIFWPTVQEYVDEVIEALLEKEVPFVRFLSLLYSEFDLNITSIRSYAMHHLLQRSLLTWLRE